MLHDRATIFQKQEQTQALALALATFSFELVKAGPTSPESLQAPNPELESHSPETPISLN